MWRTRYGSPPLLMYSGISCDPSVRIRCCISGENPISVLIPSLSSSSYTQGSISLSPRSLFRHCSDLPSAAFLVSVLRYIPLTISLLFAIVFLNLNKKTSQLIPLPTPISSMNSTGFMVLNENPVPFLEF
ncbi:hypothetical protein L1887_10485 [Cichorium endivia]|nr:hypothetical protein L1887_10485 [Cichorium endivia]